MTEEMAAMITARIAELEAALAVFVEQANREIAARQGGIAALQALLIDTAGMSAEGEQTT